MKRAVSIVRSKRIDATERTCHDQERRQSTVLPEQDIRVQPVSHHDCPFGIKIDSELKSQPLTPPASEGAYFALTQSSIVFVGFPVHIGSRPRANRSGALIDPAPGNRP
jgi:hypothetical protein